MFLIVFSFVSSKLNKNSFLSLDRTIDHGFEVPWVCLVCTRVEFVLSIGIKSVVVYNHLYERRVCSFDRNQMVQILILRFTLNVRLSFACSDGHKGLKFQFAGGLQFTHVQISY